MSEYKVCTKCKRTLEVTQNFYKSSGKKGGYRPQCKECMNTWQRKYYKDNDKERIEYQRIYERVKRNRSKKYSIHNEEIKDIEDIEEEYKEGKYYEGTRKTVTTTTKKPIRNSSLVKDYKEYLRKKQNGKIYCEICGQWEQVEEMLEVHHKVKITDYEKQNKEYSTFDDVILLCPNCHKLIHIFGSIEDIKKYGK